MNVAQLRSFLAVARLRSFTSAGEELHLTQPAVTRHIQKLERELGVSLFVRRRSPVEVSAAGAKFLAYADEALSQHQRLITDLKSSAGVEGKLRIAASTTPGEFIVPELVTKFTAANPGVRPEVMIADSAQVVQAMRARQADVGFVGVRLPAPDLQYINLGEDEVVLAVPDTHPFAEKTRISLTDLEGQLFLEREGGSGTLRTFRDALEAAGLDVPAYRIVMVLSNPQAIVSAVRSGCGVGLVSSLALNARGRDGSVRAVRFEEVSLRRSLFAVLHRSRRLAPAGAAFTAWVKHKFDEPVARARSKPAGQFPKDSALSQDAVAGEGGGFHGSGLQGLAAKGKGEGGQAPEAKAARTAKGSMKPVQRRGISVSGIVQGVGFRPFVFNLARSHNLAGFVRNDAAGVAIEIEGPAGSVEAFSRDLVEDPPPLARIDGIDFQSLQPRGEQAFRIEQSETSSVHTALISPDMATCDECLAEIRDPEARRYGYAFTNCTNCGPRFTITKDVPYDRPNTTMAGFAMCEQCAAEYEDPADRRFHAQPIACPLCGPSLSLTDPERNVVPGDEISGTAKLLAEGRIIALKGLGGYHLACDAANEAPVAALRSRKHREDKPFALMAADLQTVEMFCRVGEREAELLGGHRRPIVLLPRLEGPGKPALAASVAGDNRFLGFMLAYTPLHHLLLDALRDAGVARPVLVMTSGNVSDEPIAYSDDAAYEDLKDIADYFLVHNRPIHIRCDDSVVRVFEEGDYPIRRARGYAPEPLSLSAPVPSPILAVGAELKHTFCLAKQDRAFVSHHIGDLENWETMQSFLQGIEHFSRIFEIYPRVVAHDLHPEYLSTKWVLEQLSGEADCGLDLSKAQGIPVQHHHAHIASCLADNHEEGPVIGLALDGAGWGDDATIWGGEVLVADLAGYRRFGHLRTVPLAGGTAAIKQPWRMAAVYLDRAFGPEASELPLNFVRKTAGEWPAVLAMARSGVNSLPTSSAGRLFDAVAALCGLRGSVNYEGQAAIELEQLADPAETRAYRCTAAPRIDGVELFRQAAEDLVKGASPASVSAAFHNGFAMTLVEVCVLARQETSLNKVALSGGTFQNQLLLGKVVSGLERHDFSVFRHQRVPANDGGISLGQAAAAAARIRQPSGKSPLGA